ncbi:hypothetical protein HS088_TW12G00802 [Tripterygium wilfordii]|uniref:Uncharacterized protein n=2 Tax=Tripterygium wilfordii TaxID=458696 RepID=A0A7J7CZU0_TRIWF|nr:uncharacterized protein LOC120011323 isoform X1 [Tripterygium wilfordii]KAF5739593.1 hypothetical protein HS088_TW12G00802 [Tripterygium wilfordii]
MIIRLKNKNFQLSRSKFSRSCGDSMASTSSAAARLEADDEWELCNDDDGFIYKRKKRLRVDDPELVSSAPDPELERRSRRGRKRRTLLRLKREYQSAIDHWENLSNTLHAMQEKTQHQITWQQEQQEKYETALLSNSPLTEVQGGKDSGGSLVDELLLQIEAQEAIIHDVSNLCDVAEAMYNAQEERLKQQYFDLPIWSSLEELMASLCDER